MSRQPRIDVPNGYHHVVGKGVNGQLVFFSDTDRLEFGRLLAEVHDRHGVLVFAYCLMDNHFHLIVHCPDGGLSAVMQHLCGVFARHVNERVGREGHLFGSRFYSGAIDSDRFLLTAIRYVERNALDLPGIDAVDQYRWSSHRANADLRRGPEWLASEQVLNYFASTDSYRRFIGRSGRTNEAPNLNLGEIELIVPLMISIHATESLSRVHLTRTVAVLLIDSMNHDNRLRGLAALGLTTARSAAQSVRRAHRRLERDPGIAHIVAAARSLLLDAVHGRDDIPRTA